MDDGSGQIGDLQEREICWLTSTFNASNIRFVGSQILNVWQSVTAVQEVLRKPPDSAFTCLRMF